MTQSPPSDTPHATSADDFAIRTEALTKFYGERAVLHPLTLAIPRGEVFGFLGHNGAGKTTTIRLLTTLLTPSSGRAWVAGHECSQDPLGVRASIGYLPENLRLYDQFTARENLDFFARLSGVSDPKDAVGAALAFLDIEDLADQRVGQFSKGMRQRVGLAQAILHGPEVLFLDEPTSGLDPMGVRHLRHVLDKIQARGMTIFMNTHILSEVGRSCSSLGVLAQGRLIFHDRMEAISAQYDEAALEALYLDMVAPCDENAA